MRESSTCGQVGWLSNYSAEGEGGGFKNCERWGAKKGGGGLHKSPNNGWVEAEWPQMCTGTVELQIPMIPTDAHDVWVGEILGELPQGALVILWQRFLHHGCRGWGYFSCIVSYGREEMRVVASTPPTSELCVPSLLL